MTRHFRLHYVAASGDKMFFLCKTQEQADLVAHEMTADEQGFFHFCEDTNQPIWYRYQLVLADGQICERHNRYADPATCDVEITDQWRSPELQADTLRAEAFARAVFPQPASPLTAPMPRCGKLIIALSEPRIQEGEEFCIVSNQFMHWDVAKAMPMKQYDNFIWQVEIDKTPLLKDLEFKFAIADARTGEFRYYEEGQNHHITIDTNAQAQLVSFNGFCYAKAWRAAGVAVPVFSLRTAKSRGCGEFSDLIPLVDWCYEARLRVIQLLPINDTTATLSWRDSYPYNAISTMALHPNYISVQEVYDYYGRRMTGLERENGLCLNDINISDYNRTRDWKLLNLQRLYNEAKSEILADTELAKYLSHNNWWLRDYCVFAALKQKYATPDFRLWPEHSRYDATFVAECFGPQSELFDEVMIRAFVQFHLERQLRCALNYAHSKNVALKGDLPIGINPNSVEAWVNPEFFDFGLQAGAPPDFFSQDGQNWGFPIYNWDLMASDGFLWWQRRMSRMQQFFDAFRIDHILGFFRIWSIPKPFRSGLMGIFSPALPYTAEELKMRGLGLAPADCTLPLITQQFAYDQLGEFAQQILDLMFLPYGQNQFIMKKEYFGTAEANNWLEANIPTTKRDRLRNGWSRVVHEVLMVSVREGEYHPRIMLSQTARYALLDRDTQNLLCQLHDDFFFQRNNEFWKEMATKHLGGMLGKCQMLVCGEDLGMIPSSVPLVMQRMQILSLEMQRMPKYSWDRYGQCQGYPYMSVCATSSHDISNIRGWWEENASETQWYYNNVLRHSGEAPRVAQENTVAEIMQAHLDAPSMLCINPIQDYAGLLDDMPHLLPAEERINQPADQNNRWQYRVPFCIEQLTTHFPKLHQRVRDMVEKAERGG